MQLTSMWSDTHYIAYGSNETLSCAFKKVFEKHYYEHFHYYWRLIIVIILITVVIIVMIMVIIVKSGIWLYGASHPTLWKSLGANWVIIQYFRKTCFFIFHLFATLWAFRYELLIASLHIQTQFKIVHVTNMHDTHTFLIKEYCREP